MWLRCLKPQCNAEVRKSDFKVYWGHPVPSHTRPGSDKEILRGHAAGVAIMARIPSFGSRPSLPEPLAVTCRVVEAFVKIGALPVRFLAVYGYPQDSSQAVHLNADLFNQVRARITESSGDFNQRPELIPACQDLLSRGYQDVHTFYRSRVGEHLPCTCRGRTGVVRAG